MFAFFPKFSTESQTVNPGQHDVEHDRIIFSSQCQVHPTDTVHCKICNMTLVFQIVTDIFGDVGYRPRQSKCVMDADRF